jgi:spore coat polysaccharide biosynthesis protein SpsF
MGSSRLPGKSMIPIEGRPSIEHVVQRLKACKLLSDIVLATTISTRDDCLEAWARNNQILYHRGSEDDVLQRVVDAHRLLKSDIIVEITGDCVLLDPELIDYGIELFQANDCDVLTNARIPSYPQGVDLQIFRFHQLEKVEKTIDDPAVREHVSLYFYENPTLFKVFHLIAPMKHRAPELRLQLDYVEDLTLIREIYSRLKTSDEEVFGLTEILDLLRAEPHLRKINDNCKEKPLR